MTDFASLLIPDRGQRSRLIHLVDKDSLAGWLKKRPADDRALLEAQQFDGKKTHAFAILPRGGDFEVVSAVKKMNDLSPWCLAALAERLPEGSYKLAHGEPRQAALGWLLAQHQFDTYRSKKDDNPRGPRILVTGEAAKVDEMVGMAQATALVRDLVNTPAADLGPAQLEQAVADIAIRSPAQLTITSGAALAEGYPLIAAVGGGATPERAPRLSSSSGASRTIRASLSSVRAYASTAEAWTSRPPPECAS